MHRTGHVGFALLAWTPVGLGLATLADAPGLAVVGGATAVALSTLPDVDNLAVGIDHRGPTHSIAFLLAVTAGAASVGFWVGGLAGLAGLPGAAGLAGFPPQYAVAVVLGAAAGLSICSHLVGDVVTPMGVAPFWPLSQRRYSLGLVYSKSPALNYGTLLLGVLAAFAAVAVTAPGLL